MAIFSRVWLIALTLCACAGVDKAPPRTAAVMLGECASPKLPPPARCGRIEVFENRETRAGCKIALNLVVLPARAEHAKPDPVFYLAGGPGQGAARRASLGEDALQRELRRERDPVFVDLRGSGDSNGLHCTGSADLRQ